MDPSRRQIVNMLTAATIGFATCACAQPAPTAIVPTAAAGPGAAAAGESLQHPVAQAQINDAVGDLERATLERDFGSTASELALLQDAHDRLSAAARQLQGTRHEQTIGLLADLDHAVRMASSRLGPLTSPAGESFDPPVPSRNQLAQLATEGQDLQRSTPAAHRLVDGSGLGSTSRRALAAQPPAQQTSTARANAAAPSQPLEPRAMWPQIRFRF